MFNITNEFVLPREVVERWGISNLEGIKSESDYDRTLCAVRELSEHATLRPAPRQLRCVPLREFFCVPRAMALAAVMVTHCGNPIVTRLS